MLSSKKNTFYIVPEVMPHNWIKRMNSQQGLRWIINFVFLRIILFTQVPIPQQNKSLIVVVHRRILARQVQVPLPRSPGHLGSRSRLQCKLWQYPQKFTDWIVDGSTDWKTRWLTDCLIDIQLTDSINQWMTK